jgi:hypothetical protein
MKLQVSKQKIRYENGTEFVFEGAQGVAAEFGIRQRDADPGALGNYVHKQIIHTVVGGGLTETITGAIPAGAYIFGAFGKIKTLVVMATGVSFLFGITGDTNRFGNFAALTVNTAQDPSDHQVEATALGRFYAAATDILLTANAGTWTSGVVTIDLFYNRMVGASNY